MNFGWESFIASISEWHNCQGVQVRKLKSLEKSMQGMDFGGEKHWMDNWWWLISKVLEGQMDPLTGDKNKINSVNSVTKGHG